MKNVMRVIVLLAVSAALIGSHSVVAFASEVSGEEQAMIFETGKEADLFCYYVTYGFFAWCVYPEYADEETVSFAKEKGYILETPGEYINVDVDGSEQRYYPYAPQMDSLEKWNAELKKYFIEDFLGLFDQDPPFRPPFVIERDGGTYGTSLVEEYRGFFGWDEAELTRCTQTTAILKAPVYYFHEDGRGTYGEKTIELIKTENGWRVSGGSYFGNEGSLPESPPKTGEHTTVYALIFTLVVLPLAATLVYRAKKRRTV